MKAAIPWLGVLRSGSVVGGWTLVSRLFGLLRDISIVAVFGAGFATDAFLVAFKIPNFFRRLFGEGAFSQAFVPVFVGYLEPQFEAERRRFISAVSGSLLLVLLPLVALGILASPSLVAFFAPGFLDDVMRLQLTASMLRLTLPYLLCISLVMVACGALQGLGYFAVPAAIPVILNLCLIAAAWWLAPHLSQPIFALAWGVLLAGVLQLLLPLPLLWRKRLLAWPRWRWHHPGVRRIRHLMMPLLFSASISQINLLLDTFMASFLVAGSVSWLYLASRLTDLPLAVFAIALSTVLLPRLAGLHRQREERHFGDLVDGAMRLVLLLALPATLGLILLSGPIVISLFEYGAFGAHSRQMTQWALIAYASGLPAFMLAKVLLSAFFSCQQSRLPARIAVPVVLFNAALNLVLLLLLQSLQWSAVHVALAAASSLAGWLHVALLYAALRRTLAYRPRAGWWPLVWRCLLALAVLPLLLYGVAAAESWTLWPWWQRGGSLFAVVLGSVMGYGLLLWLLGAWRLLWPRLQHS